MAVSLLGCPRRSISSGLKEVIFLLCSAQWDLEYWVQVWDLHYKRDTDIQSRLKIYEDDEGPEKSDIWGGWDSRDCAAGIKEDSSKVYKYLIERVKMMELGILFTRAWWQDKKQQVQTEMQKTSFKCRKKAYFTMRMFKYCLSLAVACMQMPHYFQLLTINEYKHLPNQIITK